MQCKGLHQLTCWNEADLEAACLRVCEGVTVSRMKEHCSKAHRSVQLVTFVNLHTQCQCCVHEPVAMCLLPCAGDHLPKLIGNAVSLQCLQHDFSHSCCVHVGLHDFP